VNNFRVHFTKTVTAEVIIEADSYEEAVQLASSKKPDMSPDWVGTEEHLQKTEEYEYEVMGPCGRCKTPIVNRSIPGKPIRTALVIMTSFATTASGMIHNHEELQRTTHLQRKRQTSLRARYVPRRFVGDPQARWPGDSLSRTRQSHQQDPYIQRLR